MSIATELALLANTKESLRVAIGLSTSIPFSQYAANVPWAGSVIPATGAVFDFQKNRYAKDGKAVYLDDVSEFIRLSSATKWHDGKLVEVANNIPRISGEGLLIEPQRTNNLVGNVLTYGSSPYRQNTSLTYLGTSLTSPYYELQAIEDGGVGAAFERTLATIEQDYTVSAAILKVGEYVQVGSRRTSGGTKDATAKLTTSTDEVVVNDISPFLSDGGYIPIDDTRGVLWASRGPVDLNSGSNHYQVVASGLSEGEVFNMYAPQTEIGFGVTSYIPTDVAPATRSPDILNIPLLPSQSIAGEWDEGVTYEIVDNVATFTGHGYIRNITVEES